MTDLSTSPTAFAQHLQALIDVAVLTLAGQEQLTNSLLESVKAVSAYASTNHCVDCRSANWFVESFQDGPRLVQRGCGQYIPLAGYSPDDVWSHGLTRVVPVLFCLQFNPGAKVAAGDAPPEATGASVGKAYKPAEKSQPTREAAR